MSDTIYSPVFRYSVTFLEEGLRTGGQRDFVRIEMEAGGKNFHHFHLKFEERFEVIDGTLGVELRRTKSQLQKGESLLVPRRSPHHFFNTSNHGVIFTAELTPASRFPDVLRIAYGLARDGKTNSKGIPKNPLHIAYLWSLDRTAAAIAPPWLTALAMFPLTVLAKLVGVRKKLGKYIA